jgi:hypothetical protein
MTSWVASWRANGALAEAMVVEPSTNETSMSRPKAGGWTYSRYVLSDWVGRSTSRR